MSDEVAPEPVPSSDVGALAAVAAAMVGGGYGPHDVIDLTLSEDEASSPASSMMPPVRANYKSLTKLGASLRLRKKMPAYDDEGVDIISFEATPAGSDAPKVVSPPRPRKRKVAQAPRSGTRRGASLGHARVANGNQKKIADANEANVRDASDSSEETGKASLWLHEKSETSRKEDHTSGVIIGNENLKENSVCLDGGNNHLHFGDKCELLPKKGDSDPLVSSNDESERANRRSPELAEECNSDSPLADDTRALSSTQTSSQDEDGALELGKFEEAAEAGTNQFSGTCTHDDQFNGIGNIESSNSARDEKAKEIETHTGGLKCQGSSCNSDNESYKCTLSDLNSLTRMTQSQCQANKLAELEEQRERDNVSSGGRMSPDAGKREVDQESDDESDLFSSVSDDDSASDLFGSDDEEEDIDDDDDVDGANETGRPYQSNLVTNDQAHWEAGCYTVFGDSDEESNCSRFSEGFEEAKLKKERPKTLINGFKSVPVMRYEPECYYFSIQWGDRMKVEVRSVGDGLPKPELYDLGMKYRILFSELIARKGKGPVDDRMGQRYYKSYYLAVSGNGMKKINLRSALLSIADFESITYEKGAHKALSRLKLLASPACRPPDNDKETKFCAHRLPADDFELIEDNGHMGCGFISKAFLVELLGKSVGAQRAFAIQIRAVGPSSIGIAKGLLFVKAGIRKIQLPSSMVKVEKSNEPRPLHTDVVLIVRQVFPWTSHKTMGRLFNFNRKNRRLLKYPKKNPSGSMIKDLKQPCDDVLRVLESGGVPREDIIEYLQGFKSTKESIAYCLKELKGEVPTGFKSTPMILTEIKHATFIGVIDPTGSIPEGHVFLTGMGNTVPSEVFLTRNPCTDCRDGLVVKVASLREMPTDVVEFWKSIGFGAVVFSLGDELPSKINDGDLDGDPYVGIYDSNLLQSLRGNDNVQSLNNFLPDDDVVGMEFQWEFEGKEYRSQAVQKIQEDPDTYKVLTGKKGEKCIHLTREQISDLGQHYISEVIRHQTESTEGADCVKFECKWSDGDIKWLSIHFIRKKLMFSSPPQPLLEYVLQNKLLEGRLLSESSRKWLINGVGSEYIEEILNHRRNEDGKIEVLCRFSGNDIDRELWHPFEEQQEDCKALLGAYAKRKNLLCEPGWKKTKTFWLAEIHDLICKENRAGLIDRLVTELHGLWEKKFKELGCNNEVTLILGDAYKKSNTIAKHDVKLKLPFAISLMLKRKLREAFVELE